ncbi:hypothetical protein BTBSAS_340007 [Brochothrix thermosphacta]|uniref:Uncharacterized protein n=1 Tax=Brochothrix thermosphacta TaxID=2756 RepID=A0A2X0S8K7_BROTH|nr:hypothetical protein BTBSAS_340007 [Brochothrix thermosphacta]
MGVDNTELEDVYKDNLEAFLIKTLKHTRISKRHKLKSMKI